MKEGCAFATSMSWDCWFGGGNGINPERILSMLVMVISIVYYYRASALYVYRVLVVIIATSITSLCSKIRDVLTL